MLRLARYLPILPLLLCVGSNPQVTAPDATDLKQLRSKMQQILTEVSQTVARNFYDPKLNGVDWKRAPRPLARESTRPTIR